MAATNGCRLSCSLWHGSTTLISVAVIANLIYPPSCLRVFALGKCRLNFRTCHMWLTRYRFAVRRLFHLVVPLFLLVATLSATGATASGKVVKVLPQFLDLEGRASLSPSLYDRDAYQAQLRKKPEQRSGMCFNILWRGRSATNDTATLRVELR